ncbi:MAG: hypothetical protein JWR45_2663 [Blastococcus sp.]|jgi:hypothetical protein|nr:hypothetical protein [Blastococcus sp.]
MALSDRLTVRSLYLYLVCLVTLVVSLFAAVQLVRGTVALLYPDPAGFGYHGYALPVEQPGDGGTVDPQERERQEQLARDSARRQSVLDVVGSATTLLIAAPLYVYHWRRVQTELPARAAPADPA